MLRDYAGRSLYRIGLAGAGRWGENLIRNFVQLGALEGVFDHNPQALARVSHHFPTLKTFGDYTALLGDPEIVGIVISTPARTHFELAEKALRAGKHVYVEKPLARSPDEAVKLIELSKELNLTLMVGHLLLYHPAVNKLKELIEQNELGDIRFLNSDRRNYQKQPTDSNVIWDLAPHDVSMISYLIGNESVELVQANGLSTTGNDEVIDVAHIDIRFEGGVRAHIHNSWIDPQKQNLLTVIGSKKTAVLNDAHQEQKLQLYTFTEDGQVYIEQPVYSSEEPLRLECQHFLDCLRNDNPPLSDGIGGYKVVKLLEEADREIRSKLP
ncbi:MAG: Gfo/Idh/MocA family oxidoreductase [Candidatus Caenarcaniphilales bacterium]|nr:Gfo/Idh/MocA family oxidoreductase [Candidatus Caenarcaniphilales bacterium]